MKRIDFLYGVVSITIFLSCQYFSKCMDSWTYRSIGLLPVIIHIMKTHQNLSLPNVLQNTFVLYFHIFDCSISWSDICFVKRKGFDKVSDSMLPSLFSLSLYGVSYSIRSKIRQYERLYT